MTMTSDKVPMAIRADWVLGPRQGQWTYDDYAALPDDGKYYEIVDGVLYMSPSPNWSHQEIALEIAASLRTHVRIAGLGGVFVAPLDVELAPDNVFQPDVIVLLKASRKKLRKRHIVGAPELIVEIASPGTAIVDLNKKYYAYARAGVAEYWVVNPDAHTVEVLVLKDGEYQSLGVYRGQKILPSQVVPGFDVQVEQFFVSVWEESD